MKKNVALYTDQLPDMKGMSRLEVEAAPVDITITVEGPRHTIDDVDREGCLHALILFTSDFGSAVTVPPFGVAVQIDADNRVQRVVHSALNGKSPLWN
ncbi:hypothetical protein D3C73_1137470 [compost metagenome]